jgi:hypothetical protein
MTNTQINQRNMFGLTIKLLDEGALSYETNIPLKDAVAQAKSNVVAIDEAGEQQRTIRLGIALDKGNLRKAMVEKAIVVSGIIYAYAAGKKNETLRNSVSFSYTDLIAARDPESADRCHIILMVAREHETELTPYGLTPVLLTELDTNIVDFKNIALLPRKAISEGTTITKNLADLFWQNIQLFKGVIDKLMLQYKLSQPDFYNNYLSARTVVSGGKGRASKGNDTTTTTTSTDGK